MTTNRYFATSLIGGGAGALDNIDPLDMDDTGTGLILVVGDLCDVVDSATGKMYWYVAKFSSGQVESSPTIIIPDNNPSDWYWELITSTEAILTQAKAYAIIFG